MKIADCFVKSIWPSLLLFPMANIGLFFLFYMQGNVSKDIALTVIGEEVVLLLFVAVAEELFFRGLLLRELVFSYKWKPICAAMLISIAFAFLHLLNVNSYADWTYAFIQSICAFFVSVNISAVFIRSQSLLLCMIIHGLINITSIGLDNLHSVEKLTLTSVEVSVFLVVSIVYFVYGIKLLRGK